MTPIWRLWYIFRKVGNPNGFFYVLFRELRQALRLLSLCFASMSKTKKVDASTGQEFINHSCDEEPKKKCVPFHSRWCGHFCVAYLFVFSIQILCFVFFFFMGTGINLFFFFLHRSTDEQPFTKYLGTLRLISIAVYIFMN